MRALLDVNVLLALLDASHLHHRTTTAWLAKHMRIGWASCPLTENGCVRVMSQSTYANRVPAKSVGERLGKATRESNHAFWPDSLSILDVDVLNWNRVLTARQITEVYLLAMAVRHKGRLVTFDRGIDVLAVSGAQARNLVVLGSTAMSP